MKKIVAVLASCTLLAGALTMTGLSGAAEGTTGTNIYDLTDGSLQSLSSVNMEMGSTALSGGAVLKGEGQLVGQLDPKNKGTVTLTANIPDDNDPEDAAPKAVAYKLTAYYVSTAANSTLTVTVNGQEIGQLNIGDTVSAAEGPAVSVTMEQRLTLNEGAANTIVFAGTKADTGWIDLDRIELTPAEGSAEPISIEAESGVLGGGGYGGVVQRAQVNDYTIPIGELTGQYFVDPIGDSNVHLEYNLPYMSPNSWMFASGYAEGGQQQMGATFIMHPNLNDVRFTVMFANDERANDSTVELYASDSQDGPFHPLTVKRTAVPFEDWYTSSEEAPWNYSMYVFSLEDPSELNTSDRYIRFVCTKPDDFAGMASREVQIAAIDYTATDLAVYSPQEITGAEFGNLCVEKFGSTDVRFYSNQANVSPREHGMTVDILQAAEEGGERPAMTDEERTLGGIFTTNVPFLDYDIRDFKFHMVYEPTYNADYDGSEVTISVAAEKDGPYTPVEVQKSVDPDGADWYTSVVYSAADPLSIPDGMRYVKFEFVVSPNVDKAYKTQMWRFDLGKSVSEDGSSTGELVYRTTNMTDFGVQFLFRDGTEDEPDLKFYAADANRADAYREIEVERTQADILGMTLPEGWTSYVYALKDPASLPENADYLRVEIRQTEDDTFNACQLMAVGYDYDNTYTTAWEIRNNAAPGPVRIEGFQMVTNPYPEAVGGNHAYQLYGADEGYIVFRADQLQNFRLAFSFASAVDRDNAEYTISVAPRDMDDEYVEIETTYETGLSTTNWPNYFITPYDYNDIPAGNNYIKIESKGGFILVYMETDRAPESAAFQQASQVDLAGGDIVLTNMQLADGALVPVDKAGEASAVFPADSHSWFKAALAADALTDGVTYFTADSADGPWEPVETHRMMAQEQPESGVAFQDAPTKKNVSENKANFIKAVISPEAAAANTRITALTVHQDSPDVTLPDYAVCPEDWNELRDNLESDFVLAEDGGKADYYESLTFDILEYGYAGDSVKALCRVNPDTDAFITYHTDGPLKYFDVRGIRYTHTANTDFVFYVSNDGESWEEVDADAVTARVAKYEGGREQLSYVCSDIPEGMTYLKIEFPILETADVTEIGLTNVQLFYDDAAGGSGSDDNSDNPDTGVPMAAWPAAACLLAAGTAGTAAIRRRTRAE